MDCITFDFRLYSSCELAGKKQREKLGKRRRGVRGTVTTWSRRSIGLKRESLAEQETRHYDVKVRDYTVLFATVPLASVKK